MIEYSVKTVITRGNAQRLAKKIAEDDGRILGLMHDSDDLVWQALVALYENCNNDEIVDMLIVDWIYNAFQSASEIANL